MEKRKYSKFLIKNGENIEVYNVSYNPVDLYRFTLGVKQNYRFERDFHFVTKKGNTDINIPYEADVDKVLLYKMSPEVGGTRVDGIGIMKSEFEKIIGMSGNLHGQEVFFDDVCDKFRRLESYINGTEDAISEEEKVDLVNQYLSVYTFDKENVFGTSFDDKKALLAAYLGGETKISNTDVVNTYDYLNNLAKENKNALIGLKEKGVKVLEKIK